MVDSEFNNLVSKISFAYEKGLFETQNGTAAIFEIINRKTATEAKRATSNVGATNQSNNKIPVSCITYNQQFKRTKVATSYPWVY